MKFRTEIELYSPIFKIEYQDLIFSMGSCFASLMAEKLQNCQIRNYHNPFGTLFHPKAIEMALERIIAEEYYIEEELLTYNQGYLSLDHHSSFNAANVDACLDKINTEINFAHQFLKKTKWVIITLGTSLVYNFLPSDILVANCHKLPQDFFSKHYLSPNEINESLERIIYLIKSIAVPDVQIIFTISPVRHSKEGLVQNQYSKSLLNVGLHQVIDKKPECTYLPVYEIMMDDLRDYRFYKSDMIHPTTQAFEYVWGKFKTNFFSTNAQNYLEENWKIYLDLQHKPINTETLEHQKFLMQLKEKIQKQQKNVSFTIYKKETEEINKYLQNFYD